MTTANHLINALAAQDKDQANSAFESMIQDRLADYLEVAKVEIASGIMDDLQEGQGMDAQRRWVRHVAAIGKGYEGTDRGHKVSINRNELKQAARKYYQSRQPHGAAFVDQGASQVRDARKAVKRLQGEEAIVETGYNDNVPPIRGKAVPHDYEYEKDGKVNKGTIHVERSKDNASAFGAIKVKHGVKGGAIKKIQVREETLDEGGPTRKHFQQVADLIKEIPDAEKRKAMAQHHAGVFKSQNPRFDHKRFYAAAGVSEALDPGSKPQGPSNAQINRNVMTNIRKAVQTLRVQGVNPTIAAAGHRDFGKLAAKNPKAPGYMLLRKLAPNKAQAVQNLTQAGVPLGGALEAHPNDFNQAIQRIKRFK